jgi:hypothetical protein
MEQAALDSMENQQNQDLRKIPVELSSVGANGHLPLQYVAFVRKS